jgi:hypothetical protein
MEDKLAISPTWNEPVKITQKKVSIVSKFLVHTIGLDWFLTK